MPSKLLLFFALACFSCHTKNHTAAVRITSNAKPVDTNTGRNIFPTINDVPLPENFIRPGADSNSFAGWLRQVHLKSDKTVYLFDGRLKQNQQAQFAVLDISVPHKDLQQCADAVMRLRAEYLFAQKKFDAIHFTDNDNTAYTFHAPYNRENFMCYLERVFGMCGSASLSKQLKTVTDFSTIQPGDVLIRGGFPGHAVIVMDVAENSAGKKIFTLAQSYMPAQDIHLLVNPNNEKLSPWYEVDEARQIITPEYLFYKTELKTW